MRPEDVPSDTPLRDMRYSKIKDSPVLRMVLLVHYEMVTYDVPKRSYQTLLGLIDRCIMRQREQKNMRQTQVDLRLMIEGKDQMAAPAKTKGNEKDTATPAPKKGKSPRKETNSLRRLQCFPKAKQKLMRRPGPARARSRGTRPSPPMARATGARSKSDANSSSLPVVSVGTATNARTVIQ